MSRKSAQCAARPVDIDRHRALPSTSCQSPERDQYTRGWLAYKHRAPQAAAPSRERALSSSKRTRARLSHHAMITSKSISTSIRESLSALNPPPSFMPLNDSVPLPSPSPPMISMPLTSIRPVTVVPGGAVLTMVCAILKAALVPSSALGTCRSAFCFHSF